MKKSILGLYLSDQLAQALLLSQDGGTATLEAVAEWQSTLFSYAGDDTPGVDEFVERVSQFVSASKSKVDHLRLSVDSSLAFINTIPLPSGASRAQIDEHIIWELERYFPDLPKGGFVSDMHVLNKDSDQTTDNILIVAIRRDLVQKLRRASARLDMSLDLVDVDHFSAESALRSNYPETANKFVALVCAKPKYIEMSFMRYGELESYSTRAIDTFDDLVACIRDLSRNTRGLSSIAVYGTHLDRTLLMRIRNASALPVEAFNPFRNVDIVYSVRSNSDLTLAPYRFAAAVGAALRE
ncbi:MAG: pilus assembly protein PilM [Ignavibacteriae bacterium]|nr:pilus assembly protein PilM [Ignavibacteriota bacterium]